MRRRRPVSAIVGASSAQALEAGRAEIARRLAAEPARGRMAAACYAFLADQIVRLAYDSAALASGRQHRGRGLALVGLGGTGRGEMAPFSDVDLMFLVADRGRRAVRARWSRRSLYLLWDLKLKVGHVGPHGRRADRAGQDAT